MYVHMIWSVIKLALSKRKKNLVHIISGAATNDNEFNKMFTDKSILPRSIGGELVSGRDGNCCLGIKYPTMDKLVSQLCGSSSKDV